MQVRDAQQEMQDLQIAFDAKESLVRRLEYDRKMKSGVQNDKKV